MADERKIKLDPGDEWIAFICINQQCAMPILVVPISAEMLDAQGNVTIRLEDQQLTCPYCKQQAVYRAQQARRVRAEQKQKLN